MEAKNEMVSRFFRPSAGSFFLFGPRGTGKSSWVSNNVLNGLVIDLLSPETLRNYSAKPERLLEVVRAAPIDRVVVIDEVQKIPELLSAVHLLMEENRDRSFILTGSSARKLKRAGVDLLAGRAALKRMHGLMASEIGESFDLDKALTLGMVPLVRFAKDPQESLNAYIALYLKEEVKDEGLVRNLGEFSRFLEAASFSHAQVLNVAEVARECEANQKTVFGYLEILEDLLLAFRLPVFSKRAKRILIKHPKFYFFDAGVFRHIRPKGPLDRPEEIAGACLEGLVAQHLRAWVDYSQEPHQLFYWRTKSGTEVDFIVYGPSGIFAIEVKHSRSIRKSDLNGLMSFVADYPEAQPILLYCGKERMLMNGVLCMPCQEFLSGLVPDGGILAGPKGCDNYASQESE